MAISRIKTEPTGISIAGTIRAEVQDFLNTFATALMAGDGETVATLWETPALVIGKDGVMDVDSPRQVAQFFGGARQQYNTRGITQTRADLIDLERIDDRIIVATVRWPYLDEHGHEMGAEASDYTLRRDDRGQLKLRCVLQRGIEQPRR